MFIVTHTFKCLHLSTPAPGHRLATDKLSVHGVAVISRLVSSSAAPCSQCNLPTTSPRLQPVLVRVHCVTPPDPISPRCSSAGPCSLCDPPDPISPRGSSVGSGFRCAALRPRTGPWSSAGRPPCYRCWWLTTVRVVTYGTPTADRIMDRITPHLNRLPGIC